MITQTDVCRICASPVTEVADLGEIHINDFPAQAGETPGLAPLVLDQCNSCSLVQLRHTVDPQVLYGDHYWYESALNPKLKANLLDIAEIANSYTQPGDSVLDIGANDGSLLSGVHKDRTRIGCEPASNLWAKCAEHTDVLLPSMWDSSKLKEKCKVVTAIGMFYDMDNPNEFISGVKDVLADDGIFIAQLMTLAPMIQMRDLGNICHEHLEYYTYASLVELYERNGLEIYHVEENDIQGGSYQLWARHLVDGSIEYAEDTSGLQDFFDSIAETKTQLHSILNEYKRLGKRCYVYGASTKGNTLLQIWDLGEFFDGAAEIHTEKFGRYTVGTDIPIVDEREAKAIADVFFVPNFGFKDMFVEKEADWIFAGGAMLFAMPKVEVVQR